MSEDLAKTIELIRQKKKEAEDPTGPYWSIKQDTYTISLHHNAPALLDAAGKWLKVKAWLEAMNTAASQFPEDPFDFGDLNKPQVPACENCEIEWCDMIGLAACIIVKDAAIAHKIDLHLMELADR